MIDQSYLTPWSVACHPSYTSHPDPKEDVKVCDDGTLIKIVYFWTLSIVMFYLKRYRVFV
jgi:hypothetical protein